jgi:hypothetical protein
VTQLYADVMKHDPLFFTRVDQFVIEVHLCRTIGASNRENVLNWGKLLALLHRSGLRLQHSHVRHCSLPTEPPESYGVVPLLRQTGYHRTSAKFGTDGHCHNYLFARA